jgi:predicted TIM-barrel enzyme
VVVVVVVVGATVVEVAIDVVVVEIVVVVGGTVGSDSAIEVSPEQAVTSRQEASSKRGESRRLINFPFECAGP